MSVEYSDELENQDVSDDIEFWSRGSVPPATSMTPVGRSRWQNYTMIVVSAVILLLLIITFSVSYVKIDRRFSATETHVKNLSQTLLSILIQTHKLDEREHSMQKEMGHLDFLQQSMKESIDDMSDSQQRINDKISELNCKINTMQNKTEGLCCPDGWFLYSSHCYYFSDDGKSWESARDECENKRSVLLILKSQEEKEFVVTKTTPLFYWLGLSDSHTGQWEWLDGTPYVMMKSEWMPGQPDDWQSHGLGGGEDCAHFHHDGRYNDDHCSRGYRYVCKTPASATFQ